MKKLFTFLSVFLLVQTAMFAQQIQTKVDGDVYDFILTPDAPAATVESRVQVNLTGTGTNWTATTDDPEGIIILGDLTVNGADGGYLDFKIANTNVDPDPKKAVYTITSDDGDEPDVKFTVIQSGQKPYITGIYDASSPLKPAYGIGDVITIEVLYNQAIKIVGLDASNLSISLQNGATPYADATYDSYYNDAFGQGVIVFKYTVTSGSVDADNITMSSINYPSAPTQYIRDAAELNDALTYLDYANDVIGDNISDGYDGDLDIDVTIPTITLETIASDSETSTTCGGYDHIIEALLSEEGNIFFMSQTDPTVSSVYPTNGKDATPDDVENINVITLGLTSGTYDVWGEDLAGNSTTDTYVFSVVDGTRPSPTIAPTNFVDGGTTNVTPIEIDVEFSESVTIVSSDVSVTPAGPAVAITGSGTTWDIDLTGMTNGTTYTVNIPEKTCGVTTGIDASGNPTLASNTLTFTYDNVGPTPTVDAITADPTNATSVEVKVYFSEELDATGLEATDITVTGGSVTSAIQPTGSADIYSFTIGISPSGDGNDHQVTVGIKTGVVADKVGNTNADIDDDTFYYDGTRPMPTISSMGLASGSYTNQNPSLMFTVTFNEEVTGFASGDFSFASPSGISEIDAGTFKQTQADPSIYTFSVTLSSAMDQSVPITYSINPDVCTDIAGNNNLAATDYILIWDITSPDIAQLKWGSYTYTSNPITINASDLPLVLTVLMDEEVNATIDGTQLNNGSLYSGGTATSSNANRDATSYDIFTFNVALTPQISQGDVTVTIPDNVVTDLAGNSNNELLPSRRLEFVYDGTQPEPTIFNDDADWVYPNDPDSGEPTTGHTAIPMHIDFGETVQGLTSDDLNLTNAQVVMTTTGNADSYSLTLYPQNDGVVEISVPASVTKDLAGNDNVVSDAPVSFVFDGTGPTVDINPTTYTADSHVSTVDFTATFSEELSDFNTSTTYVKVSRNTTGSPVTIGSTTIANPVYGFQASGIGGDGVVVIDILANAGTDLYGNESDAATSKFTITVDAVQPTPTITAASFNHGDKVNEPTLTFTVTFNEGVKEFGTDDVIIAGFAGAYPKVEVGSYADGASSYEFTISPTADEEYSEVTVDINAAVCSDMALPYGNPNIAAAQFSFTYSNVGPTPTISWLTSASTEPTSPTNVTTLDLLVDWGVNMSTEPNESRFSKTDVSVSGTVGGVVTILAPNSAWDSYQLFVDPNTGEGTVIVDIPAGVASDADFGNPNKRAKAKYTIIYDDVRPKPTVESYICADNDLPESINSTVPTVPFTVRFEDYHDMTDFNSSMVTLATDPGITSADLAMTGPWSTNTKIFSFEISNMSGIGDIRVDVAANAATDEATNKSVSGATAHAGDYNNWYFTIDRTRPVPTITHNTIPMLGQLNADYNTNNVELNLDFGEKVIDFIDTDISAQVIGGTGGAVAVENLTATSTDDGEYTFELNLTAATPSCIVSVSIAENVCTDVALNNNSDDETAFGSFYSFVYDGIAPTASISNTGATPTNGQQVQAGAPFNFQIEFTEYVNVDVASANIVINHTYGSGPDGWYSGLVRKTDNQNIFTFNIGGFGGADRYHVTIDFASSSASDLFGNDCAANANHFEFYYDNIAPTPTISYLDPTLNETTTYGRTELWQEFNMKVDWGTAMNESTFIADDITITDVNGGANPTITVGPNKTSTASIYTFTVKFDNTAASASTQYKFEIALGDATNQSGVANLAATPFTVTYDGTRAHPTITANRDVAGSDILNATDIANLVMQVEFNKTMDATTFASSDIGITGANVLAGPTLSGGIYTFTIDPTITRGNISISMAENTVQDQVDNWNSAAVAQNTSASPSASVFTIYFDNVQPIPTITLSSTTDNPVNVNLGDNGETPDVTNIHVTIKFGEDVDVFESSEVTINNVEGDPVSIAAGTFAATTGTETYEFNIEDLSGRQGVFTIDVAVGVATNSGANTNLKAKAVYSVNYDGIRPAPTLSSNVGITSPTNQDPITLTINFNEPLGDYTTLEAGIQTPSGWDVVPGSLTQIAGDEYTVQIETINNNPATEVEVKVLGLPNFTGTAIAMDEFDNWSSESAILTITYDGTIPVPTITPVSATNPTNSTPIKYRVDFGEDVGGFMASDITATLGTSANVTGGPAIYTFEHSIAGNYDTNVTVGVVTSAASDGAGSWNTTNQWSEYTIGYDNIVPEPTIISPVAYNGYTNANVKIVVDFGDALLAGFDVADISVSGSANATKTLDVSDDANGLYTFTIGYNAQDGVVNIDIPAGVATDEAMNSSLALAGYYANGTYGSTTPYTFMFDQTAPNLTVDIASLTPVHLTNPNSPNAGEPYPVNPDTELSYTMDDPITNSVRSQGESLEMKVDNGTWAVGTTPFTLASYSTGIHTIKMRVVDAASNITTYDFQVEMDNTKPQPTITAWTDAGLLSELDNGSNPAGPLGNNPIYIKVEFSEDVNGYQSTDLQITGSVATPSIGNYIVNSASEYEYQLDFGQLWANETLSTIKLDIDADVATDNSGLNSLAAKSMLTIEYDPTAPVPTIYTNDDDPSKSNPIYFYVDFGKTVRDALYYPDNFTKADVNVSATGGGFTRGTVTDVSASESAPSRSIYGFSIALDTDNEQGILTLDIPVGMVKDLAGNDNVQSNIFTIEYDRVGPTPTIVPSETHLKDDIFVDIYFDEEVFKFTTADVTIAPFGSMVEGSWTKVSPTQYRFDIDFPTNPVDQYVTITVEPSSCHDNADNWNNGESIQVHYDRVAPTPYITSLTGNPSNNNPMAMQVAFTDLDAMNNPVPEGIIAFQPGPDMNVNYTGNVTLSLAGVDKHAYEDTQHSIFTFNVNASDLQGYFTLEIPAGAAQDTVLNNSNASAIYTFNYDYIRPTATITSEIVHKEMTNKDMIAYTITFSEEVVGFGTDDISVTNAAINNWTTTDNTVFTFDANTSASVDGWVNVYLFENVTEDLAGNMNEAADGNNPYMVYYDGIPPTPVLSVLYPAGYTYPDDILNETEVPIVVQADFGEPVGSFTVDDINIDESNAYITNFALETEQTVTYNGASYKGGLIYTFELNPIDVIVRVDIPANVCTDKGGNLNNASNILRLNYEGEKPVPLLSTTINEAPDNSGMYYTNNPVIPFEVTFREEVTGFTTSDIRLQPPFAISNFATPTNVGPEEFKASFEVVVANHNDQFEIDIPANGFQDINGNWNALYPDNPFTITYDIVQPTPVINEPLNGLRTNDKAIFVEVEFDEPVEGFAPATDVSITNASYKASTLSTDDNITYSFAIVPNSLTDELVIGLTVKANTVTDYAGNNNVASTRTEITYDGYAPKPVITAKTEDGAGVSITSGSSLLSFNDQPIRVYVDFSEKVDNFVTMVEDVVLGNATATSGIQNDGNGKFYFTIDPTEIAPNTTVTIDIEANVASDLAGNWNRKADQFNFTYDGIAPAAEISVQTATPETLISGGNVNGTEQPLTATVKFGEPVYGFIESDLVLNNANATLTSGADGDSEFVFTITPSSDGQVTLDVYADVATDLAGNNNTAATQFEFDYDGTKPTPTLNGSLVVNGNGSRTNDNPIIVQIVFDEVVTGFDNAQTDIQVTNGVATNLSGAGTTYTVEIIPDADGLVSVTVPADVCVDDPHGNLNNAAATAFEITYDGTSPTLALTSTLLSSGDWTNATSIPMVATFSEDVDGFVAGDIAVTNGSVSAFGGSGMVYTFNITGMVEGTDTEIRIDAAAAQDLADNDSEQAIPYPFIVKYDGTPPTPVISSTRKNANGYINGSATIELSVVFDDQMMTNSFDGSHVVITHPDASTSVGTITNRDDTNGTYTVEMTATVDGEYKVNLAAGQCQDKAGNLNNAAAEYSFIYDTEKPTPTVYSVPSQDGDTTNTLPIMYVDFGEEVEGFSLDDDLNISNAIAGSLSDEGNGKYSFQIAVTPIESDVQITISVPKDGASDLAGNLNEASNTFKFRYDKVQPTAEISVTDANGDNVEEDDLLNIAQANNFEVRVDYSEAIYGTVKFSVESAVYSATLNGALSYTFTHNPDETPLSTITISDISTGVTDYATNALVKDSDFSFKYDGQQETAVIQAVTATTPSNDNPMDFKVTFGDEIVGLAYSEVVASTGVKQNWDGTDAQNGNFTFELVDMTDGIVTVTIADGVANDDAGNPIIGGTFTIEYDGTAPEVALDTDIACNYSGDATYTSEDVHVTLTFTDNNVMEDGTTDDSKIVVTPAATIENGVWTDDFTYEFDITGMTDGEYTVNVEAGFVEDLAGNANNALATPFEFVFDNTAPTATISSADTHVAPDGMLYTNMSTITVDVAFSEEIQTPNEIATAIAMTDVNGVATINTGTWNADNTAYSFTIDIADDGAIDLQLPVGTFTDVACVSNTEASDLFAFNADYDHETPVITVAGVTNGDCTNDPINVTVDFTEPVTGFDATDVDIAGNGTVGAISTLDNITYEFEITGMTTEEDLNINIAADAAQDYAWNSTLAATQFSLFYDITDPTPTMETVGLNPANYEPITVAIDFNEVHGVTGFDQVADIVVTNGGYNNLTQIDGNNYTIDISPDSEGDVIVTIVGGAAEDCAGNGNNEVSYTIHYDVTKPVPTISSTAVENGGYINDPTIPITVTFSEEVFDFDANDVMNAAYTIVGNVTDVYGDGTTYAFTIDPVAEEEQITMQIAAGAAYDDAMNDNEASDEFVINYDAIAPTPMISATVLHEALINDDETPVTVTVFFGEEMNELTYNQTKVVVTTPVGDVEIADADITWAVDMTSFDFDIDPVDDGDYTINVYTGACEDLAGNASNAASNNGYMFEYDATQPQVTVSSTLPSLISQNHLVDGKIPITLTFDEPVNTFNTDKIEVVNGTPEFVANPEGTTYVFNITPDAGDMVEVEVRVNELFALDLAGNPSVQATPYPFVITYDGVRPQPEISTERTPTNESPIVVWVEFDEDVTGFEAKHVEVTGVNETKGLLLDNTLGADFAQVSPSLYSFNVTPQNDEQVITVSIDEYLFHDIAGNDNLPSDVFEIEYDGVRPVPVITSEDGTPNGSSTNNPTIDLLITFNEEMMPGFSKEKVSISGGTIQGNMVGPIDDEGNYVYKLTVEPVGDMSTITVDVAEDVATDLAGNTNVAADPAFVIYYDGVEPNPTITFMDKDDNEIVTGPTNADPMKIMLDFGETVNDFDVTQDVLVQDIDGNENGFIGAVSDLGNGQYVFNVTNINDGTFRLTVVAGAVEDMVSNTNIEVYKQIVFDGTPPQPVITSTLSSVTAETEIPVTVTFGETVNGFTTEDVVISTGTITNWAGTDSEYTFTVVVNDMLESTLTVDINANVAKDNAGNDNLAAAQFAIDYDHKAPVLAITSPLEADIVNGTKVVEFTSDDAVVTQVSVDGVNWHDATSGVTTLADITEFADLDDGAFTLYLKGCDALENWSENVTEENIVKDATSPVVEITKPANGQIVGSEDIVEYTVDLEAEPNGIKDVHVRIDDNEWILIPEGDYSEVPLEDLFTYFDELEYGDEFTVTIKAEDKAGNVGEDAVTLQKGTLEPPVVSNLTQSAKNSANEGVNVQSNLPGYVYIVLNGVPQTTVEDLEAAVAAGRAARADVSLNQVNKDVFIPTDSLEVPEGQKSATYYAYAVDVIGRKSDKGTNPITIIEGVLPVPDFFVIGANNQVKFINASLNGVTYRWQFGDGDQSTDTNPTHIYDGTGTYNVTLTAINEDETEVSVTKEIEITQTGIEDLAVEMSVKLYPNPSDGRFAVEFTSTKAIDDATIRIMDINGRIIQIDEFTVDSDSFLRRYDISAYSKGVYLIQLQTEHGIQTKRVVVQK